MRKKGKFFKRTANATAMQRAFNSVMPLDNSQTVDLGMAYWQALHGLTSLHPDEEHFHTLAASVNIGMVLCERGIVGPALPDFIEAGNALAKCWNRFERVKKLGLSGPEMIAVREALKHHDMQLKHATKQQAAEAVQEVIRRKDAGDVIQLEQVPA